MLEEYFRRTHFATNCIKYFLHALLRIIENKPEITKQQRKPTGPNLSQQHLHSKGNPKGKTKTNLRIGKLLADEDTYNELGCNTHTQLMQLHQKYSLLEGTIVLLKVFTFVEVSKDLLTK